jgi:hypothetical protein
MYVHTFLYVARPSRAKKMADMATAAKPQQSGQGCQMVYFQTKNPNFG